MAPSKHSAAAPAASVNDGTETVLSSPLGLRPKAGAPSKAPRDRICRYALGAETVLRVFAEEDKSDWAWGLHQIAQDASIVALSAAESGVCDSLETASMRYAKANAVFSRIAHESDNDLLLTAESLLEMTKDMIDGEVDRLIAEGAQA